MQIVALFFTAASIADFNFITLGHVKFTSAFNHLENCHYSYEATCPIAYPLGHFQNMNFVATKLQLPFVSWYIVNHFPVTPVAYLVRCRYSFKNFADFQKAFSSVLRLRNCKRKEILLLPNSEERTSYQYLSSLSQEISDCILKWNDDFHWLHWLP